MTEHTESRRYITLRQGLWLVVDLVDDLLERGYDEATTTALQKTRAMTVDLLFAIRKLEALED